MGRDCPLCNISKEAIDKLDKSHKEKPPSKNRRFLVWLAVAVIIVASGITIYKFSIGSELDAAQINGQQEESLEITIAEHVEPVVENNQEPIDDALVTVAEIIKDDGSLFAEDFTTSDIYGSQFNLVVAYSEKPVLLIFWATWCGFCAKELEDLKTFYQQHQDEITIAILPSGEVQQTIVEYVIKENINFSVLLDEQKEIWNQYGVRGTPSHFLIDKQGEIITLWPGLATLENMKVMLSMVL